MIGILCALHGKEPIMNQQKNNTLRITRIAMLGAIIVLMALTPLGYLKIGPLSITFLTVPVVIGAVLLGVWDGAVLGAIFGLTSFAQCFGMDQFGAALLSINPVYTAIVCIVPRILIGIFSGAVYRALSRTNLNDTVSYAISAFVGAITNTIFFVGMLILLFKDTEPLKQLGDNVLKIISVLVTTNSVAEVIVCTVLVAAVSKACAEVVRRRKK